MKRKIDVVKIVVENEEGKILAVREAESEKWELPGGKIDQSKNESLFNAAARELEEEVNLEMESGSKLVRTEIEEFNSKPIVNCYIIHTKDYKGTPEISTIELDKFRWVEPEQYKNLEWHTDSGYGIPAVEKTEKYL